MIRQMRLLLAICLTALALAGCSSLPDRGAARLEFEAPMDVNSSQEWHVSLGVRNVGEEPFRDNEFFGTVMELRDSAGDEVGRIQVTNLWDLEPDQCAWPASFRAQLAPGAYTLTWGAPDYGGVVVRFTIVELDDWLYLGEEWIQTAEGAPVQDEREHDAFRSLVSLAKVNLAQRLGIDPGAVIVREIAETMFSDPGLGLANPGTGYARPLTPGYVIKLEANDEVYCYHASDERLVFAPVEGEPARGSVSIDSVTVTAGQEVVVRGHSTLPEGTCLGTELWANGELQDWWPGGICVPVEGGMWEMVVPLGRDQAPAELDVSAQYMLRAFQQDGPNVVSVFGFDLAAPPTPEP